MPMSLSTIASRPAVTSSPEATTASYSRVVEMRARLLAPGDELVGLAGHGGDDDRDLVAGVDLALDVARDVADALDIGDRRAAEFHHQTRQAGLGYSGKARGSRDGTRRRIKAATEPVNARPVRGLHERQPAPSVMPRRSRVSTRSATPGGTPTDRWRRCTG